MKEIGVAVIGCGIRGRHAYEHALLAHPQVRVRAVAHYPNSSPELREGHDTLYDQQHAAGFGADFYGEDYQQVLAREDIRIVSLMVEPGQVADYVEQVAAAGKHILVDKPMAPTVAEGRRVVAAVRKHGIKLLVAFNERYSPPFRQARERLAGGGLGNLLTASVRFMFGGPLEGFRGNAACRQSFGGGEFANFGCYCADYLNWLAGSRPVTVFARMGTFFYDDYREAEMDDLGECVVRYDNGVIGTILAGRPRAVFATPPVGADITAERGSLVVNGNAAWMEVAAASYRHAAWGSTGVREMAYDFVEAVINDAPSPIPAEAGLACAEIVEAAYKSADSGQPVSL